jgi:hypothetical protein
MDRAPIRPPKALVQRFIDEGMPDPQLHSLAFHQTGGQKRILSGTIEAVPAAESAMV